MYVRESSSSSREDLLHEMAESCATSERSDVGLRRDEPIPFAPATLACSDRPARSSLAALCLSTTVLRSPPPRRPSSPRRRARRSPTSPMGPSSSLLRSSSQSGYSTSRKLLEPRSVSSGCCGLASRGASRSPPPRGHTRLTKLLSRRTQLLLGYRGASIFVYRTQGRPRQQPEPFCLQAARARADVVPLPACSTCTARPSRTSSTTSRSATPAARQRCALLSQLVTLHRARTWLTSSARPHARRTPTTARSARARPTTPRPSRSCSTRPRSRTPSSPSSTSACTTQVRCLASSLSSSPRLSPLTLVPRPAAQVNRQGPDTGTQYRSAIFTTSDAQVEIAKKVRDEVQKAHYPDQKIATTIEPVAKWWDAEDCTSLARSCSRPRRSPKLTSLSFSPRADHQECALPDSSLQSRALCTDLGCAHRPRQQPRRLRVPLCASPLPALPSRDRSRALSLIPVNIADAFLLFVQHLLHW